MSPEYPNLKSLFSQGGSLYGLDLSTPFLTLFVPHYFQASPSPPVKIVPQTQSPSGGFSVNPSLSFPRSGASGLAIPDVSGDGPRPRGPARSVTSELSPSSRLHQVSHSFVPRPPAESAFLLFQCLSQSALWHCQFWVFPLESEAQEGRGCCFILCCIFPPPQCTVQ